MKRAIRQLTRRMTSLALALCMLLTVCSAGCAVESPQPSAPSSTYTYLLEKGLPQELLDHRTEEELEDLYLLCSQEDVEFAGYSSKHLYNNDAQPFGVIPAEDMLLQISKFHRTGTDNNGRTIITECEVRVYYEWAGAMTPLVRKEDAIAVNWDPDVWDYVPKSFSHTDYLNGQTINSLSRPGSSGNNFNGLGWTTYFRERSQVPGVLSGSSRFVLASAKDFLYPARTTGSRFRTSISVDYVHDKNPLPLTTSFSFSIGSVGIGITFDANFADEATASISDYYQLNP